jgi:hypothetical protein
MSAVLSKATRNNVVRELAVAMKYPENNLEQEPEDPKYLVVYVTPRHEMKKVRCTPQVYFAVAGTPAEDNPGPPDGYSFRDANFCIVKGRQGTEEIVVGVDVLPNIMGEKGMFSPPIDSAKAFLIELSIDQSSGSYEVKHVPDRFPAARLLRLLSVLDGLENVSPGTSLEEGATISSVVGTDVTIKIAKSK